MDSLNSPITANSVFDPSDEEGRTGAVKAPSTAMRDACQSDVLAFLAQPDSYGYGFSEPVDRLDLIQTVMFMVGPHCFKLRRQSPVGETARLTLDQRYRLACRELELGKSFAPELYLGLVPIRRSAKGLSLQLPVLTPPDPVVASQNVSDHAKGHDDTQVVDWLVMLRRYDFSKAYDKRVEIYQPNFADCQQLADLIAPGYAASVQRKASQSWLTHLHESLGGYSDLVRTLDRSTKQTTLRACYNRAIGRLDHVRNVIHDRGKRGLIGPIHGNLSLGNVVELPGGLRLVNPQVSRNSVVIREWVGDPLYDLASMIGELWSRGMTRQANWVFSHYCNRLLDSHSLDGLEALDLYLFVRSMEQAKILSAELEASKGPEPKSCHKTTALNGYIKTARDSLVQDEAMLVVVGGSTHANRSHLARLLAPATGRMPGALYLSAQQEMLTLYEVSSPGDLPQSAHRQSVWRLVYRRLADKARLAMQAGYSVILEGRFDSPVSRQNLSILSNDLGSSVRIIAFHLFDSTADGKPQNWLRDLEARADGTLDPERAQEGSAESGASVLSGVGIAGAGMAGAGTESAHLSGQMDWTQWSELDASQSVGSLVSRALAKINPAWTPSIAGTMH